MGEVPLLRGPLDAVIVVPPVGDVRVPSLAAHLLQACARRAGFGVSVLYGNVMLAARMGLDAYDVLCPVHDHLFGERLFAAAAYGLPSMGTDGGGVPDEEELVRNDGPVVRRVPFARLRGLEPVARQWVEQAATAISATDVRLVGFTSCYQQTSASVALARTVKARRPDVVTVIGGANCRGVMAEGVASLSAAIDIVVRGEGEQAFVALLQQLCDGAITGGRIVDGAPCAKLDDLPLPDYSDYFEQLETLLPDLDRSSVVVPYDCVRGCWWGRARPCTFCGYDTTRVPLREKSPDVVLRDLASLQGRYPSKWITMADPAIPRSYWKTVVPALARQQLDLSIVWLARAPLALDDAVRFRQGGVKAVEIGIESFSTPLLARMHKGTTAADNVAALRHCRIAGLQVFYNLLFGIPNDEIGEYDEMLSLMPLLRHLQPPDDLSPIRLLRFSPYVETPSRYAITDLRPAVGYARAFPATADTDRLAYRWQAVFPSESIEKPDALRPVSEEVQAWRDRWFASATPFPQLTIRPCPGPLGRLGGGLFMLIDTRGLRGCPESLLIDRAQARAALASSGPPDSPAARFAREHKLAVMLDGRHVPLAVAVPDVMSEFADEGGQLRPQAEAPAPS